MSGLSVAVIGMNGTILLPILAAAVVWLLVKAGVL